MRLITEYLEKNECYTTRRSLKVKGVMVHSTGANNPKVSRYVPGNGLIGYNTYGNHWNRPGIYKCVHAFVGLFADGDVGIVQTFPWNCRAWHCGVGTSGLSANDTHLSFEICEDGLTDPVYFSKVYSEAVELTAYLCEKFGLDPLKDGVVICHSEGYKRGIASQHADVMHWFPKHGKTMDDFRKDVGAKLKKEVEEPMLSYEDFKTYMDRYLAERGTYAPATWAVPEITEAIERGIVAGKLEDSRPEALATRQEVIAIINRATK